MSNEPIAGGSGPKTVLPVKRWLENGHIFLWLIKDTCWVQEWRIPGMLMIGPTVGMAVYFTIKSWGARSEFIHSLAVTFWILANSIWMAGEFYKRETRPIAAGLFMTGLTVLVVYYLFFFRKDLKEEGVVLVKKKE